MCGIKTGNEDLIALYSTTASMDDSVYVIQSQLQCPPLQAELQDLLFNSICDDTFMGLYILWVSQYSTVLFLFLLSIVGSVVHNFFGAFWHVKNDDVSILEKVSKRHEAVERALQTGDSSRDLDHSDHSDDEEDEFEGSLSRHRDIDEAEGAMVIRRAPLEVNDSGTAVL